MSVGKNLQEMENVVTKNASPAEPMAKGPSWEDLGGPTPENSKPDDDSNKLKETSLKQVRDVVNSKVSKESVSDEVEEGQEVVTEDEVVAESEETTDEVVAESEETTNEVIEESEEGSENEIVVEYNPAESELS